MPEYSLFVQANVTSDYGGTVYALAFKDNYTETDNDAILAFFDTHKDSLTPMTSAGSPNPNQYSTYLADVFTNVDSNVTHPIPYNFSDYSVFVVAQNDLQLTSAGYTGRFNAFSDLSEEELVTNTVIVFHDHVNQDFSVNRVEFSSDVVETVDYYVVGFVDEPAHANLVYDYIDSIKEYEGIYGTDDPFLNRVRVAGTVNVPTMTLSTSITHVVKDVNVLAPESLYDLNDINAAVFYVYAEGSTSGNVSLTRHEMFEANNVSHARIKAMEFNADRTGLVVDVSGFSGTGTPTRFEAVAVEQSHYRTAGTSDAAYLDANSVTSTVTAGPREVFTATIDLGSAIDASGSYTSPVDSKFEYVVLLRLVIDDTAYNDTTVLPENVGASTVFDGTVLAPLTTETFDTPNVSTTVTSFTHLTDTQINADVVVHGHPVDDVRTTANVVASTVPGLGFADVQALATDNLVAVDAGTSDVFNNTVQFTNVTDGTGASVPLDAVNSIHLYDYVQSFDDAAGYTLQPTTAGTVSVVSGADAVFPKFTSAPASQGYDKITAELASVFNNTNASETNTKMFLRKTGVTYVDTTVISNATVPGYAVQSVNYSQVFSQAFDNNSGDVAQIEPGENYEIVVALGNQHQVVAADVSGIKGITGFSKNFNATSGHMEITNVTVLNAISTDVLYGIAFTYDVLASAAIAGDLDAFQTTIRGHANKVTLASNANSIVSTDTFTLTQVVDANGDLEPMHGTNTGFVYLWIENAGNESAVNPGQIDSGDYLYPHLPDDPLTLDFARFTVSGGTLLESNIIGPDIKIDKYYMYLTKHSTGKVGKDDAMLYFATRPVGDEETGVPFGFYDDITPDVDTHDIFPVPSQTMQTALVLSSGSVVEEPVQQGTDYIAVLVAVNTHEHSKAYESTLLSSGTDDFVTLLTFANDADDSVDLSAEVTNGNGHTFKIGLFTSKQDILGPFSSAQHTSAAGFTGTLSGQEFDTVFDGSGSEFPSEYTNSLYAYAWLERTVGGETETTPALERTVRESTDMYPRIHSVSAAGANVTAFMPADASGSSFGYTVYAYDPATSMASAETSAANAITTYLNPENTVLVVNGASFTGMTAPATNVAFDVVMVMKSSDGSTTVSVTQTAAPQIGDTTFTVIEPPAAEPQGSWELLHRDVHTQTMTIGNYNNTVEGEADFANHYSQMGDWSTKFLNQEDYFSGGKYLFRLIPYKSGDARLSPATDERFVEFEQSNDITSSGSVTDFAITGSNFDGVPNNDMLPTNAYAFVGLKASSLPQYATLQGTTTEPYWGGIIHGPTVYLPGLTWLYQGGSTALPAHYYAEPEKLELYIWKGPKYGPITPIDGENTTYSTSTEPEMGYVQPLSNGDKVHSSGAYVAARNVAHLFTDVVGNWDRAWHGPSGMTPMKAVYEFATQKTANSMTFWNVPPAPHYAGPVAIEYWNPQTSQYIAVTNPSAAGFTNATYNEEITITFDTVSTTKFKITVDRHTSNTTSAVGLSEWRISYNQ